MRRLAVLARCACAAAALLCAPTTAAAREYLVRVYPKSNQAAAQAAMNTFVDNLGEQLSVTLGTNIPKAPLTIAPNLNVRASSGQPAGASSQVASVQVTTGVLGLIQQRSSTISSMMVEFSFKDRNFSGSSIGLTATYASIYPPNVAGDSPFRAHEIVIYYVAAREAFKLGRKPEALYYIDLAQGLAKKAALSSPDMQAVMADIGRLKAQLKS